MSDEPRPDIQVHGRDGAIFRYFALCGAKYSPAESGWVLILTGTAKPVEPQALTVADVLGDLRSMGVLDPPPELFVEINTQKMIEALEKRASELPDSPEAAQAYRDRAQELRQELKEAFGDAQDR